jgi:hypothetical protein
VNVTISCVTCSRPIAAQGVRQEKKTARRVLSQRTTGRARSGLSSNHRWAFRGRSTHRTSCTTEPLAFLPLSVKSGQGSIAEILVERDKEIPAIIGFFRLHPPRLAFTFSLSCRDSTAAARHFLPSARVDGARQGVFVPPRTGSASRACKNFIFTNS